jgi:antitoxin component YwqK of YwqJK toxin-antitoxin module
MNGAHYVGRIYTMDGVLKADGHFADPQLRIQHGEFTFYHSDGSVESKGSYDMGRKSGVWQRFDEWGRELAEKVYNPEPLMDILYTRAEAMPQYPGGQKELVSYLRSKATGPDGINTHGTMTVGFVVERDGKISEAKVIEGGAEALDQRVVDALMASPPWIAGKEKGLPVRVQMKQTVPY